MKYSRRYKKWFYSLFFFVLGVAGIEALFPIIWMKYLDNTIVPAFELLKTGGQPEFWNVTKYAILYMALGLMLAVCVHMFIRSTGKMGESVMFDIRQEIFAKLQELSFSYYDKSAVGWLMTRITSDTQKVTELISWGMIELAWGISMIIFCSILMFIYNWKLAFIVTGSIPLLIITSTKIRALILKYSRFARRHNSEMTAAYNEHIAGVEVNKSLGQEDRVSGEFNILSRKMNDVSYRSAYFTALYTPVVIFIGAIAAAIVLYVGGIAAVSIPAGISIGMLAAFFGYATLIFEPIMDISRFYSQAQSSLSAGERIFSLLDTQPEILDKPGADDFSKIKGNITFENVSFHYEADKPVLKNIDLDIAAGESVALVGETGGGKSTIINLICRFYEPTAGKILIDGEDYLSKTIFSLRSQLGIVLQTPHLFSGTIRENIQYGRENATNEEIIHALTVLGEDEYINRLDEVVGEGGENLSLGEKQLISFARAILSNPRIFIMDEATSSVDTLTEAKIQKGIQSLIEGRTSLIIAHRLSTIKNCDRIIVIKKGEIVEEGSHYELMEDKGYYYDLYTRQLSDEKEVDLVEEDILEENN